jgi:hypothetical protein
MHIHILASIYFFSSGHRNIHCWHFFLSTEFKLRAMYLLGKHSAAWVMPPAIYVLFLRYGFAVLPGASLLPQFYFWLLPSWDYSHVTVCPAPLLGFLLRILLNTFCSFDVLSSTTSSYLFPTFSPISITIKRSYLSPFRFDLFYKASVICLVLESCSFLFTTV